MRDAIQKELSFCAQIPCPWAQLTRLILIDHTTQLNLNIFTNRYFHQMNQINWVYEGKQTDDTDVEQAYKYVCINRNLTSIKIHCPQNANLI